MPNHIKNRITLIGQSNEVAELFKRFSTYYPPKIRRSHDGDIICVQTENKNIFGWFNEKTGEFTDINKEVKSGLPVGWEFEFESEFTRFPDFEKVIIPPDDPAYRDEPSQKEARENINWWYTWNVENWGTKWNSYSCVMESLNVYTFETAWSSVPKVIEKISKEFPDVEIRYEYADEDTGSNCGSCTYIGGVCHDLFLPESGTKEAYELSFLLRPEIKDDMYWDGTTYTWKEL